MGGASTEVKAPVDVPIPAHTCSHGPDSIVCACVIVRVSVCVLVSVERGEMDEEAYKEGDLAGCATPPESFIPLRGKALTSKLDAGLPAGVSRCRGVRRDS